MVSNATNNTLQDEVLVEKLKNEIAYEKEFSQSEKSDRTAQRANIDSFLQQYGFEVRPSIHFSQLYFAIFLDR
jgi:hypothetical protein